MISIDISTSRKAGRYAKAGGILARDASTGLNQVTELGTGERNAKKIQVGDNKHSTETENQTENLPIE